MWAINKLTTKGTDRVTGTATVTESGCLKNCDPRPEVGPKCKTKATTMSTVQGKSILACLVLCMSLFRRNDVVMMKPYFPMLLKT